MLLCFETLIAEVLMKKIMIIIIMTAYSVDRFPENWLTELNAVILTEAGVSSACFCFFFSILSVKDLFMPGLLFPWWATSMHYFQTAGFVTSTFTQKVKEKKKDPAKYRQLQMASLAYLHFFSGADADYGFPVVPAGANGGFYLAATNKKLGSVWPSSQVGQELNRTEVFRGWHLHHPPTREHILWGLWISASDLRQFRTSGAKCHQYRSPLTSWDRERSA